MPVSKSKVHLDGVKNRERERRAANCYTESDKRNMRDNLDCELADLLPEEMRQLEMMRQSKRRPVQSWCGGKVPYTISSDLLQNHSDLSEIIKMAIRTSNKEVRSVKWIERKRRQGGRQTLELASWANTGNVLHEMGHAIGLTHEQCRLDRDHFVTVYMEEIEEGYAKNFTIKGIPLGPYDYDSIMHYSSCAFSKNGKLTIEAPNKIGQRKGYSELDLKGIESIYGPQQCTYERYGENYWPQYWFECRTCWGDVSNYGCCLICALNCHSGPNHHLVHHEPSPDAVFACDCGRNHHQKAVCTWHSTKTKFVKQPFYHCHDCFQSSSRGCCYQCVNKCHAGHNTSYAGIKNTYCDCGLEGCRISCLIPGPLECTYKSHGENYHSQHWYECQTCWGGESNYGCCVYCAFNCHAGHTLVHHKEREDIVFVCDCGRNHHQKSVCTWHATKTKSVKQPFYHCYDCFQSSVRGCCYQCVKKCHAGHNTSYAGIKNTYCDCGLECCQISCLIAQPQRDPVVKTTTSSTRRNYAVAGSLVPTVAGACMGGELGTMAGVVVGGVVGSVIPGGLGTRRSAIAGGLVPAVAGGLGPSMAGGLGTMAGVVVGGMVGSAVTGVAEGLGTMAGVAGSVMSARVGPTMAMMVSASDTVNLASRSPSAAARVSISHRRRFGGLSVLGGILDLL